MLATTSGGGTPTAADRSGVTPDLHAEESIGHDLFKLVDLKGQTKLVPISGSQDDWRDWHFRTKAAAPSLSLGGLILKSKQRAPPDEASFTHRDRRSSLLLWPLLFQLVAGRAYTLLRLVPIGHGATAWHKTFAEYEAPDQVARQMNILVGLLELEWRQDVGTFLDKWLKWELQLEELAANCNISLPDHVKAAILLTKSPKPIRRFLENQTMQVQATYATMRVALRMFLSRARTFDREDKSRIEPMGVDELPQDAEVYECDSVDDEELLALLRNRLRPRQDASGAGSLSSTSLSVHIQVHQELEAFTLQIALRRKQEDRTLVHSNLEQCPQSRDTHIACSSYSCMGFASGCRSCFEVTVVERSKVGLRAGTISGSRKLSLLLVVEELCGSRRQGWTAYLVFAECAQTLGCCAFCLGLRCIYFRRAGKGALHKLFW